MKIYFTTIINDNIFNYFKMTIKSFNKTQINSFKWIIFDCGLSKENLDFIKKNLKDCVIKHNNFNQYKDIVFEKKNRKEWNNIKSCYGNYNPAYRFDIFDINMFKEKFDYIFYVDADIVFLQDLTQKLIKVCNKLGNVKETIIGTPRHFNKFNLSLEEFFNCGFLGLNRSLLENKKYYEFLIDSVNRKKYQGNQRVINDMIRYFRYDLSIYTLSHNENFQQEFIPNINLNQIQDINLYHYTGKKDVESLKSFHKFASQIYGYNKNCEEVSKELYYNKLVKYI